MLIETLGSLGLIAAGFLAGLGAHWNWIRRRGGSWQEAYGKGWEDRGWHDGRRKEHAPRDRLSMLHWQWDSGAGPHRP